MTSQRCPVLLSLSLTVFACGTKSDGGNPSGPIIAMSVATGATGAPGATGPLGEPGGTGATGDVGPMGASGSTNALVTTGSVGGVVLDDTTGFPPLAGANVTVVAGGSTFATTTDATGSFGVSGVPIGTLIVRIAAAGHFEALIDTTLGAAAATVPNPAATLGPIILLENNGSLVLRLVTDDGTPAASVPVTARAAVTYLDESSGVPVARGGTSAAAVSDASGIVTLTGLPDYARVGPSISDTVVLNVPPIVLGGVDDYAFLGLTMTVFATQYTNLGQTPTVVLTGPRSALTILSSNLDWFETGSAGPVGSFVTDAVTVAFNQTISPASFHATLLTETGDLAPVTTISTIDRNVVSMGFSAPPSPGRYNILVHADAAGDQAHTFNAVAPFFVASGQAVTIEPSSQIDPTTSGITAVYILRFSEPVGLGSGRADAVPCVVYYETSLDGSGATSAGEWTGGGNSTLVCAQGDPHLGYYLRPFEPNLSTLGELPVSGFSSVWKVSVGGFFSCTNFGSYVCSPSGATLHLQFSRNADASFVMRRANGAPLSDMAVVLPAF